jgi:hypothetical protein
MYYGKYAKEPESAHIMRRVVRKTTPQKCALSAHHTNKIMGSEISL